MALGDGFTYFLTWWFGVAGGFALVGRLLFRFG